MFGAPHDGESPELLRGVRDYCTHHRPTARRRTSRATTCSECREFLLRWHELERRLGRAVDRRARSDPTRLGRPRIEMDVDTMWECLYAFEDWLGHLARQEVWLTHVGDNREAGRRGIPEWAVEALRTTRPDDCHGSVNAVAHVLHIEPRTLRRRIEEYYGIHRERALLKHLRAAPLGRASRAAGSSCGVAR